MCKREDGVRVGERKAPGSEVGLSYEHRRGEPKKKRAGRGVIETGGGDDSF